MNSSRKVTGAQRVAAFLLSLKEQAAADVFRHLDAKVTAEVVEAMTALDQSLCTPKQIQTLYRELARDLHLPLGIRIKEESELAPMLESTLGPDRAQAVLNQIHERRRHEHPFLAVEEHPAKNIANALAQESDAVIALVLAHVDPVVSADVLGVLEQERALSVVRRMASLAPPPFETLNSVARELEGRLKDIASGPAEHDSARRLKTIAEMLNYTEPPVEKSVLDGLNAQDQVTAASIRELMFSWEDLAGVDKRAMQKILATVDTKTLSISLKACSHDVENNIMGNLSARVREMIVDERELAGAVPLSEVHAARGEIMKAVRGLIESGEFRPARSGEELVT